MRGDWIECKFDDVFFTTSGGTPSRRNENYYIGNIPWIKSGELKSNVITEAEEFISEEAVKNSSAKVFPAGTILLALYGATIGKIAILGIPAATNQAICGIFETPFVFSKYAYYYLVNKKSYLIKQGIGGAQPNISQTILKNLDFSLAPLPEQRAIVKKLESLFSSLDAGVADLKKAQQQLKIYRQAVLKKAFEGELTNIQEKPDVVSFEGEIQIVSGNTPKDLKTAEKIGDLPFYKVSDMNLLGNEIYMSNSNIFLSRTQFHKMKLKTFPKGTIIFPKRGGAILTNKKRILSQDSTFDLNLMGIIPNENFSSKYLYYYFYKMDLAKIADGSAVPQINNKNINPLQIQKYSIDEQKEIVKQIESRLSVCDSIEQNIKESLEKAEALRQSILKKAFEGNLLTAQELAECKLADDYEPASVLLERIKAEQTEIKAKPSKKKPRHSVAKSQ